MIRSFMLVLAAGAFLPAGIRAREPARADEPDVVAEALFLCDTLPPGGRDLNLSLALEEGDADPATGETRYTSSHRVQLAMALGERAGLTADVGIGNGGALVDAPGASLRLLLRAPDARTTGLAVSFDLFGSSHGLAGTEVGLGLGAIRAIGRFGLRTSASVATGVSSWSPRLHGGASAAVALGSRWRLLAEAVADVGGGDATIAAGPTVKLALGDHTALMVGALFPLGPSAGMTAFTTQLTRSM
jgi:hypothetical protein